MWSGFVDDLEESSDKSKAVDDKVEGWRFLDPV